MPAATLSFAFHVVPALPAECRSRHQRGLQSSPVNYVFLDNRSQKYQLLSISGDVAAK
jgi:hypothetical protein